MVPDSDWTLNEEFDRCDQGHRSKSLQLKMRVWGKKVCDQRKSHSPWSLTSHSLKESDALSIYLLVSRLLGKTKAGKW